MAKKKQETIIKETTKKLLTLLGVEVDFDVEPAEDHTDVVLKTDEGGILIGYHGETLEALQLVLSLCIAKSVGEFVRISIEVGDYKKNRTEWLKQLVEETKQRALAESRPVTLPDLKSWERRVIHMLLQEDAEVTTESLGEGRDRILEIRPK